MNIVYDTTKEREARFPARGMIDSMDPAVVLVLAGQGETTVAKQTDRQRRATLPPNRKVYRKTKSPPA
jgi:hypothetical protein